MPQVVTISATTAGYAAEPLKAGARVSGSSPVETTVKALSEQARKSGDLQQRALMNVVRPPALALFFLTTTQQQHYPQTTREQAEEEYRVYSDDADDTLTDDVVSLDDSGTLSSNPVTSV